MGNTSGDHAIFESIAFADKKAQIYGRKYDFS